MQGKRQVKAKLVLNANADRSMTEVLAKVQQVKYRLPPGATDPVITKITDGASEIQYISFMSDTLTVPQMTDFATRVAQPLITAVPGVASAEVGGGQTLAIRIWSDPVKLTARGLSASDLAPALLAYNGQSTPAQTRGKTTT